MSTKGKRVPLGDCPQCGSNSAVTTAHEVRCLSCGLSLPHDQWNLRVRSAADDFERYMGELTLQLTRAVAAAAAVAVSVEGPGAEAEEADRIFEELHALVRRTNQLRRSVLAKQEVV